MVKIAPSILSADFAKLGAEIEALERSGADMIHIDVMDGHYVPNLTIGPPVIKSLRSHTKLPFDVHLMITNPDQSIDSFIDAGADIITFHPGVTHDPIQTIAKIKSFEKKTGIAINPEDNIKIIEEFLPDLDLVLIMTVNPGFGGQKFIESGVEKIATAKNLIDASGSKAQISVDGGINKETACLCTKAGADILVAGSAVFSSPNYAENINSLRGS